MSGDDAQMTLIGHLEELRSRLVHSVIALFIAFTVSWFFRRDLLYILKKPLLDALPEELRHTILLKVLDKFFIDLKVAMIGALFLAAPYILLQIWLFIAPGLYTHEKRLALPVLFSSTFFFILGVLFCYFMVMPLGFSVLVQYSQGGSELLLLGQNLPDAAAATDKLQIALKEHIGFTASLLFAFGVAFETPLFMIITNWVGVTTPQWFAKQRKYAIVVIFILAGIMTPPDPWTQALFAIPLLFLYEVGIWGSRLLLTFKRKTAEEGDEGEPDETEPLSSSSDASDTRNPE